MNRTTNRNTMKALAAAALVAVSGLAAAATDASTVPSREQRMDEALQNYRNVPGRTGGNAGMASSSAGMSGNSTATTTGAKDGGGAFARAEAATKRGFHRAGNAIKRGANKVGAKANPNGTQGSSNPSGGDTATPPAGTAK